MYTLREGRGRGREERKGSDSDGHIFGGIDAHLEKEHVVFDEVALLEHFVRYKARETETQRIGRPRRTLEVLPRRIRNETLDDVTSLVKPNINRLITLQCPVGVLSTSNDDISLDSKKGGIPYRDWLPGRRE